MTRIDTVVIVGASLASVKAAEALRGRGFDGSVVVLGAEPELPYQRPPLSKEYLSGGADLDDVHLHAPAWYADNGVEVRTSVTVTALDPRAHNVYLEDGQSLTYDKLLLATGSGPRRLDVPGAHLAGIHYLRTLADADQLAKAAAHASGAVVVGAGWLGSEVAASLRGLSLPVTLLDVATVPLERVLGTRVGSVFRDLHAAHGTRQLMRIGVSSFLGTDVVEGVRTTGGHDVPADLVVVAVGAAPRTELAASAGLAVEDGVLVDQHLRASAPDVYAAGDVSNAWHPVLGRHLRVEHWANAVNQGSAAAASMLGAPTPYDRIPYFFSDQYDLGMEYSGYGDPNDDVALRGDPSSGAFLAFWLRDGVVVAGMSANIWGVTSEVQELVRHRARVDPRRLADADTPLPALLDLGS